MAITLLDSVATGTLDSPVAKITATLPLGAPAAGNLLLAAFHAPVNISDRATRAGWNPVGATNQNVGPNLSRMDLLWRVAQGGDPAAMQFEWLNTSGKRVFVSRWSGSWAGTAFDSESVGTFGVASPSQSHTPTAGREALIYVQGAYQQGSATAPGAGLTEIDDGFVTGGNNPRCWSAYRVEAVTSGSYSCGCTWSNCCFSGSTLRVASFLPSAAGVLARSQSIFVG